MKKPISKAPLRDKKHPHRGYLYERTQWNTLEKSFADCWEAENIERPGVNYGLGILDCLFLAHVNSSGVLSLPQLMDHAGPRDRWIAATVVQWLGTNCGFAFLTKALSARGYSIVGHDPGAYYVPYVNPEPIIQEIRRVQDRLERERLTAEACARARQLMFDLAEPS